MDTNNRFVPSLLAFVVIFIPFTAIGFLFSGFDWTLVKIIICIVVVGGVTLAWSMLKKLSFGQSFREVGYLFRNQFKAQLIT